MPSGRSVGPSSNSEKGAKTCNCPQKYAFCALLGPNFCSKEMLKHMIVFKIIPSGRSVGPTSNSEKGTKTYNWLQKYVLWSLLLPNNWCSVFWIRGRVMQMPVQ